MFQTRSRLAVIIAKIIGVVLLVVAVSIGQDALDIQPVAEKDVFTISGRVRFIERSGEGIWKPKKQVLAQVENYPASFFIDTKSKAISVAHFDSLVKDSDTARIAIHKDQLALLYTKSTLRLYGIFLGKSGTIYSFTDAFNRDKKDRLWLYVQAGICLLGGLLLLWLPKKYLIKE